MKSERITELRKAYSDLNRMTSKKACPHNVIELLDEIEQLQKLLLEAIHRVANAPCYYHSQQNCDCPKQEAWLTQAREYLNNGDLHEE